MSRRRRRKTRTVEVEVDVEKMYDELYDEFHSDDEDEDEEEDDDESASGNFVTRTFFQPKILILLAVVVSSFFVYHRYRHLLPNLNGRGEYRIQFSQIQVSRKPHWLPADFLDQVAEGAGLPENVSLLEKRLADRLADAFRLHPWVESVESVRVNASEIHVDLSYRKPVAMVKVRQGLYPIDASGVLLPPADFSAADTRRFPVIRNANSMPVGPAGTTWGDARISSAARLAEVLLPHWKTFELTAIDVPHRASNNSTIADLIFKLSTSGGSQIVWGRAPGSGHPGELTAEQKIGRIQDYVARFGRFDQSDRPYKIEIHHWRENSRTPLTSRRQRQRR